MTINEVRANGFTTFHKWQIVKRKKVKEAVYQFNIARFSHINMLWYVTAAAGAAFVNKQRCFFAFMVEHKIFTYRLKICSHAAKMAFYQTLSISLLVPFNWIVFVNFFSFYFASIYIVCRYQYQVCTTIVV